MQPTRVQTVAYVSLIAAQQTHAHYSLACQCGFIDTQLLTDSLLYLIKRLSTAVYGAAFFYDEGAVRTRREGYSAAR